MSMLEDESATEILLSDESYDEADLGSAKDIDENAKKDLAIFLKHLRSMKALSQEISTLLNDLKSAKKRKDMKEVSRLKTELNYLSEKLVTAYEQAELRLSLVKDSAREDEDSKGLKKLHKKLQQMLPQKPAPLNISVDLYDPEFDDEIESMDSEHALLAAEMDQEEILNELPALIEIHQKLQRLESSLDNATIEPHRNPKKIEKLHISIDSHKKRYLKKYEELKYLLNRIKEFLAPHDQAKAREIVKTLRRKFPPAPEGLLSDESYELGSSNHEAIKEIQELYEDYQEECKQLLEWLRIKSELEKAAKSRQTSEQTQITRNKLDEALMNIHTKVSELEELKARFFDKYARLDESLKDRVIELGAYQDFSTDLPQISPRRNVSTYFPQNVKNPMEKESTDESASEITQNYLKAIEKFGNAVEKFSEINQKLSDLRDDNEVTNSEIKIKSKMKTFDLSELREKMQRNNAEIQRLKVEENLLKQHLKILKEEAIASCPEGSSRMLQEIMGRLNAINPIQFSDTSRNFRPQSQAGTSRPTGLPQPTRRPQSQAIESRANVSQIPSRPISRLPQRAPQANIQRSQASSQPAQPTYSFFNLQRGQQPPPRAQQPSRVVVPSSRANVRRIPSKVQAQIPQVAVAKRPATSQEISTKIQRPASRYERRYQAHKKLPGISVPTPMFEGFQFNSEGFADMREIFEECLNIEGTIEDYIAKVADHQDKDMLEYEAVASFIQTITDHETFFEDYERDGLQIAMRQNHLLNCIYIIFEGIRFVIKIFRGDNFDFRTNQKRELGEAIEHLYSELVKDSFTPDYRDRIRKLLWHWYKYFYNQNRVPRAPSPKPPRRVSTPKAPQREITPKAPQVVTRGPRKLVQSGLKVTTSRTKAQERSTTGIAKSKAKIERKLKELPVKPLKDVIMKAQPYIKAFLDAFCREYHQNIKNLKKFHKVEDFKAKFHDKKDGLLKMLDDCYKALPYQDLQKLKIKKKQQAFDSFLETVYAETSEQPFGLRVCVEKLQPYFIECIVKRQMKNQLELLEACAENTTEIANLAVEAPKSSLRASSRSPSRQQPRVSFHQAQLFSPVQEEEEEESSEEDYRKISFHARLSRDESNKLRTVFRPLSEADYEIENLTDMLPNKTAEKALKILMQHFELIKESIFNLLSHPKSENFIIALRSDLEDYKAQINDMFYGKFNENEPKTLIDDIMDEMLRDELFDVLDEISQLGLSSQEIREFVNNPHDDLRERIKNSSVKEIIFDFIQEIWRVQRNFMNLTIEGNLLEGQQMKLISRRSECKNEPKLPSVEPVILEDVHKSIPYDIIERDILHVACEVLKRNEEVEVAGRSPLEKFVIAIAERFQEGKMLEKRALMAIRTIIKDMPCIPVEFHEKYIYSNGNPYFNDIYVDNPVLNVVKRAKVLRSLNVPKCGEEGSDKKKEDADVGEFMQRMGHRHTNPDEFLESLEEDPRHVTHIPMVGAEISMNGTAVLGIPQQIDSTQLTEGTMDRSYMPDISVIERKKQALSPTTKELLARVDDLLDIPVTGTLDPIIYRLQPKADKHKTFWQARGNSIPAWYPGTFLMMPDQHVPLKYSQPFDHLLAQAWNLMSPLRSKTRVLV